MSDKVECVVCKTELDRYEEDYLYEIVCNPCIREKDERIAELEAAINEHLDRLERTNTDGKTHSVCHSGLYEVVAKYEGVE